MSKVKEITVKYERVIQDRQFFSFRFGTEMVVTVDEGEDAKQVMETHMEICREQARMAAERARGKHPVDGVTTEEQFNGLPVRYVGVDEA